MYIPSSGHRQDAMSIYIVTGSLHHMVSNHTNLAVQGGKRKERETRSIKRLLLVIDVQLKGLNQQSFTPIITESQKEMWWRAHKQLQPANNTHSISLLDADQPAGPSNVSQIFDMGRVSEGLLADLDPIGAYAMSINSQQRSGSDMSSHSAMAMLHESIPPSNHAELLVTANAAPDSFKTKYHPKSGHTALYKSFSTCGQQTYPEHIPDDKPWIPFLSQADFKLAEITHAVAMSKEQVNKLICLVWRISGGQSNFTLKSHAEISKGWAHAAPQLTPVLIVQA
ncbi:hypothetical protein BS17DRAFT_766101 [Gyrodon lividus]|nr:hypothetical protein BS17DRAFT_766101 [Gyrodon lividus]